MSTISKGARKVVLLLGMKDVVDGVADYSEHLSAALNAKGVPTTIEVLPWSEGIIGALAALRRPWRRHWAIIQYTAFSWSKRGVPLRLWLIVSYLKARGAHVAVMFHDPYPQGGKEVRYRVRSWLQARVMSELARVADASVHNVPLEAVPWTRCARNPVYIPVGSNFPGGKALLARPPVGLARTVGVFGFPGGSSRDQHAADVARIVRSAASRLPSLQLTLLVFGRGAPDVEERFQEELQGSTVVLEVRGVMSRQDVQRHFSRCHAMVFSRDAVSTQRGTVMAAIAAAVPLVGFAEGRSSGWILEAGVLAGEGRDLARMADDLIHVLSDGPLWTSLHERSRDANRRYFSWSAIAERYLAEVLHER